MIQDRLKPWIDWLGRVVTQPRSELTRWQRAARFTYDLGVYGARQLRQDRAPQMAAALAFRTLFSLVPVLVVATVLLRALRGGTEFQRLVEAFCQNMGFYDLAVDDGGSSIGDWIASQVSQAADLNLAALGWIGVLVLVYSAIGLMVTIENSFNTIYRAPEGRSWTRRIPVYWFVLTVGPVAIAMTEIVNHRVDLWISSVQAWQWVLTASGILWTLSVVWLGVSAIYLLVPNARVKLRPILIGAFVAAILLMIGKRVLGAYLEHAVSVSQIWGSLGLIPLFMFWVYVMWLLILFGLEVSAILQFLGGRKLIELERQRRAGGLVDPAAIVVVMEVVADHFYEARPATLRTIADRTELTDATVSHLVEALADADLLHRVAGSVEAVTLARPAEAIDAAELMRIGYRLTDGADRADRSKILQRLREAQLETARGVSLAHTPDPA